MSSTDVADAIRRIRRKYPSGAVLFCETLSDILRQSSGTPGAHRIEHWTHDDWQSLEDGLRETLNSITDPGYLFHELPRIIREQGGNAPSIKAYRGELRRHIQKIKTEALRVCATFRERIEGSAPHVRARHIADVYAWHPAWLDPSVPADRKVLVLAALTRHDVLENAPSDHLTMQLHRAIQSGPRAFTRQAGHDFPVATGKARPGTDREETWSYELVPASEPGRHDERPFLPAPDLAAKVVDAMTAYSRRLGDRDSDLLFLLMDRFARTAKYSDDRVRVTLDELMEAIGFRKHASGSTSGASYRPEDKAEVRRRVEDLQNAWMTVNKAVRIKGQRNWDHASSRVLVIFDKLGQREIGQAEHDPVRAWNAIVIGFGRAWSSRLFDPQGRLVMSLQCKALQYHPTRQTYEKRLAKALGFYWRSNLERGVATYRILDVVGDLIGEAPQEFTNRQAQRLEEALDRLRDDHMIGAWRYRDGVRLGDQQRMPKGWRDQWLERELLIEPPADLLAMYQATHKRLAKAAAAPTPAPADLSLGEAFRAYRVAHGISQLQAAEMLGIDNSIVSKVERGRIAPSAAVATKMGNLLRDLKSRPDVRQRAARDR